MALGGDYIEDAPLGSFHDESISVRKAKAILDANDIHEDRAQALAAIFKHDIEAYGDVNIKTILRAIEIAEIK
jgi:hypothetical protein